MIRRLPPRALRPSAPPLRPLHPRFQSTKSPSPPASQTKLQSRIDRVISRLPRSLQPYAGPLRTAPLTHLTSFLILHELTAIIPLLGIFAAIHYSNWLPTWFSDGVWAREGVQKFGRYFRRKGWFVEGAEEEGLRGSAARTVRAVVEGDRLVTSEDKYQRQGDEEGNFGLSERGVRILIEVATAWAVTKALLPLRLIVSVWATPWFAKAFLSPGVRFFGKVSGRLKKSQARHSP